MIGTAKTHGSALAFLYCCAVAQLSEGGEGAGMRRKAEMPVRRADVMRVVGVLTPAPHNRVAPGSAFPKPHFGNEAAKIFACAIS